jgi:hypothetical protein
MDEKFEDTPFTQGNGVAGGVPSAELDLYDADGTVPNTVTASPISHTGTISTTAAFEGSKSYTLTSGQTLSVGTNYQDPQNGNFQIFQFAVKVNPIPAAGTVGTFRWNHDYDSTTAAGNNSFFVRLVSTGTSINVLGGEDVAHSGITTATATLGNLPSTGSWAYITLLLNKDSVNHTDSRPNVAAAYPSPGGVPPGMHIFMSSNTAGQNVPLLNGAPGSFKGGSWAFTVNSGTMYLDDIYWDGGMDDDVSGNQKVRPFNKVAAPSRVEDWQLMN